LPFKFLGGTYETPIIGDKIFQDTPRRMAKFRENRPRDVEKSVVGKRDRPKTKMWADAQRDSFHAEYRWRPLRKFRNSIPCTTPQTLDDAHCSSAVQ